jgi:hypothetical protein
MLDPASKGNIVGMIRQMPTAFVRWLKNFCHYKVCDKQKYPDV